MLLELVKTPNLSLQICWDFYLKNLPQRIFTSKNSWDWLKYQLSPSKFAGICLKFTKFGIISPKFGFLTRQIHPATNRRRPPARPTRRGASGATIRRLGHNFGAKDPARFPPEISKELGKNEKITVSTSKWLKFGWKSIENGKKQGKTGAENAPCGTSKPPKWRDFTYRIYRKTRQIKIKMIKKIGKILV